MKKKENNKGVAIGKKQTQLETAKKLKSLGVDFSTIHEATNLSLKEIEKL